MTEPLAMLLYERVLPGGQLIHRLQDLGYRVQVASGPDTLVDQAQQDTPLVLIADVETRTDQVCAAIRRLKQHAPTSHIPVIAVVAGSRPGPEDAARGAGAEMVVTDAAILAHLRPLLDQALRVD